MDNLMRILQLAREFGGVKEITVGDIRVVFDTPTTVVSSPPRLEDFIIPTEDDALPMDESRWDHVSIRPKKVDTK